LKRTEQILVFIWIAFLLLKGVDYTGGSAFFGMATNALALFYLVGSFKLFEPQSNSPLTIPIIAGFSLATSLITIPFTINLCNWEWLQILPFINIVFTTALLGVFVLRWIRKTQIEGHLKRIVFRTFLVLVITSFFTLRPTNNQLYRNTIIFLNAGNDDVISNMRMFDYWQQSEKQLELGNCDKAVEYSLLSFNEGLKWLWIDTDSLTKNDIEQLWKIQGTYTNIYRAYKCKADKMYDSMNYGEGLNYLFKADSFLNIKSVAKNHSWKVERAESKNNIGVFYGALGNSDSATSFFTRAVRYHSDSIKTFNVKLATYLINLSESLADSRYWAESNQAAETSIYVLEKDTLSQDKNDKFSTSYLQLVNNALAENKLLKAGRYLQEVKPYISPKCECRDFLYSSILASRLDNPTESLTKARKAMICYSNLYGEQHQNIAESHLLAFEAWMKIPNYDSAIAHLKKGMELTRINHGLITARYHDYVKKEGYYYYSVGDYENSLKKLTAVRKVYELEYGFESDKLPEVLATIGRLKIEQGEFEEAKELAIESLRLAVLHEFFIDNRASVLLNEIAYINYAVNENYVSDTLYKRSIELNMESKNDSGFSVASALNGLGLLAMKKPQFSEADSLFIQSLQLYQYRTNELHPDIGIVLMNHSELFFKKRDFNKALDLVDRALENFTSFHRDNHPTIGDMLFLKASIVHRNGEPKQAKKLLEKALEIYGLNYQPKHIKIRETRNKLEAIDNRL
jgi:hypothetical protein